MRRLLVSAIFISLISFFVSTNLLAAPNDFDGDGVSDPSVVLNQSPLDWRTSIGGAELMLAENFGVLGNNLATGHYSGGRASEPAHVNSSANWFILVNGERVKIPFGAEKATYMAGADVDGDGKDDLLYHDNRCLKKRVQVHALIDPLSSTSSTVTISGGEGYFYSFYMDANGDARDDFCWVAGRKKGKKWQKRFRVICKDIITNQRITRFAIGKVYARPEPIKIPGEPDLLLNYRTTKKKTKVRLYNTRGKRKGRFTFDGSGIVVVGNYTNTDANAQQVAYASGTQLLVYDTASKTLSSTSVPEGIAYDEININHFDPILDGCICDTDTIRKKGKCKARKANGCAVQRDITDGGGNWLHKPESDNTGNIVNLFNPSDKPKNCRYENQQGELVREAFFSGNSNPNRPTWRPVGGGSCKDFPKDLVVTCTVKQEKHCWTIPNPCVRYD